MAHTLAKLSMIALLGLAGCAGTPGEVYLKEQPAYDLRAYFDGPIRAWGIVQDRGGKVINRFDVVMNGAWNGDDGQLTEDFRYYDGTQQKRVWRFHRLSDGGYEGRADDILGVAEGHIYGDAGRWSYSMDLPVGTNKIRVHFDDWMWQMHDGVLVNRSYIKKFGFVVAEVTIFMKKGA